MLSWKCWIAKADKEGAEVPLNPEALSIWGFCFSARPTLTRPCWTGFKLSHSLPLVPPHLTSHFPSPFNWRGKLIPPLFREGLFIVPSKRNPRRPMVWPLLPVP